MAISVIDDYETGDLSKARFPGISPGNIVEVQSVNPWQGVYHMHVYVNPVNGPEAFADYGYLSPNFIFVRLRVNVASVFGPETRGVVIVALNGDRELRISISPSGFIDLGWRDAAGVRHEVRSSTTIPLGSYVSIGFSVTYDAVGEIRVYVGDTEVLYQTGDTSTLARILLIGSHWASNEGTFDVDYVQLGDEYVPSEVAPPVTHIVNLESTPIVGIPVTVDGGFVGNTPVSVEVADGSHTFEVPPEVEV